MQEDLEQRTVSVSIQAAKLSGRELGTDPPKWTVYFKANQADALTAAFKEYTKKDLTRSTRPSLLTQLHKFKELAQSLGRDRVKNKEHGGPER